MRFVNKQLTEEDKKFISSFKFHQPIGRRNELARIPRNWAVDKEKNYYLICLGGQGELFDEEYPPNYYKLVINTDVIDIEARYKTTGNRKTGIKITWEVGNIVVNARKTDVDIKQIVMSAFESYGNIHFRGHIISTDFVNISEPYYMKGK